MFSDIYKNKKILITGHSGFKGSWLSQWLITLDAEVYGISLSPHTVPSHHNLLKSKSKVKNLYFSILDEKKLNKTIASIKPDFIFHLAAQAIVKESYNNPLLTWKTNLLGSINIIEAASKLKNNCNLIMITSDKCYENIEQVWGYKENDVLGGKDPYSASKASTEIALHSYCNSFFRKKNNKIRLVTARAGNVIGGGDWSNDRIVPDCVRAWSKKNVVNLRNPNSTRPWQHVLEPLSGYLTLGLMLAKDAKLSGESFNFGPYHPSSQSVLDLVKEMKLHWKDVKYQTTKSKNKNFESGLLKLNCDKAAYVLNWHSVLDFNQTAEMTINWYKHFYNNCDVNKLTKDDIKLYIEYAKQKKLDWLK